MFKGVKYKFSNKTQTELDKFCKLIYELLNLSSVKLLDINLNNFEYIINKLQILNLTNLDLSSNKIKYIYNNFSKLFSLQI